MKKVLIVAMAALILAVSFAGCANTKLAEGFDRDAVVEKAKQTMEVIKTLDYDAIAALMRKDLQSSLTADKLKEVWDDKMSKIGAFVEYNSITVIGQSTKVADYAVAIVNAKYKDGNAVFTLSFDKDMELAGMYMK